MLVPPRVVLANERGRIVFLNFFASWCVPCQQEAPALRRFAAGLQPRRATITGINVTDKRADALAFLRRYHLTYPVVFDQHDTISRRYQILGLPTTVVIDQHGRIAVQLLGPQTNGTLTAALARLARSR